MASYKCTAIVLKTIKLGEADKILSLYSPEHGPIRAVAKSARKINSKFGAKAQVLSVSEFLIGEGRNLDIVSQSKLIEDYRDLKTNYETLMLAYFFIDIIEHIAIKDCVYEKLFYLLTKSLRDLNTVARNMEKDKYINNITINFLWNLISLLGYKPDLDVCSLSHRTKNPKQIAGYLDLLNGGITSTQAYEEYIMNDPYQNHIKAISPEVYKVLRALEEYGVISGYLDETVSKSSLRLLHEYIEHKLHKEFKSFRECSEAFV